MIRMRSRRAHMYHKSFFGDNRTHSYQGTMLNKRVRITENLKSLHGICKEFKGHHTLEIDLAYYKKFLWDNPENRAPVDMNLDKARELLKVISKFKTVEELKLIGLPMFNNGFLLKFFVESLTKLKCLRKAKFNLVDVVEDNNLLSQYFAARWKNLSKLNSLQLISITSPNVVSQLAAGASIQKNLMSLDMIGNGFKPARLSVMRRSLSRLRYLPVLKLHMEESVELRDAHFEAIKFGLKKMKSLEMFHLYLSGNEHITGKAIKHLLDGLRSAELLSILILHIWNCKLIGDDALEELRYFFAEKREIDILKIHFETLGTITNSGMQNLGVGLASLTYLKKLTLIIQDFKTFDTLGLRLFALELKKCEFIEHIEIDLRGSEKIEDEGLFELEKALLSMPVLKSVKLDILYQTKITKRRLGCLNERLKEEELKVIIEGSENYVPRY